MPTCLLLFLPTHTELSNKCSCACEVSTALSTVLTFLLTLILGASTGVISVLGWNKFRSKSKGGDNKDSFTKSQKYDDIEVPGLFENNPSYKHVQRSSGGQNKDPSRKQMSSASASYPLYEDPDEFLQVKADPVTQSS